MTSPPTPLQACWKGCGRANSPLPLGASLTFAGVDGRKTGTMLLASGWLASPALQSRRVMSGFSSPLGSSRPGHVASLAKKKKLASHWRVASEGLYS